MKKRSSSRCWRIFRMNSGKSVVVVGPQHEPALHALALAINDKIGAIGSTLTLVEEPNDDRSSHFDSIADLTKSLKAKQVNTLVILGGNPVYDAPADLDFADALKSAATSIHLSLYDNETSHACTWHVPRAHFLEAWGDSRAWDGTASICQPLIEPLYDGKTSDQILAFFAGEAETESDAIVRKTFADIDDTAWRQSLNDGLIQGHRLQGRDGLGSAANWSGSPRRSSGYEVRFLQDSKLYDGRFATNGWLQEFPDPLTKIVWDNAALISKKDADTLGVGIGDMLKITVGGQSLEIAAFVLPGQPAGVIGLALGYGRTMGEHIGSDVGVNTYPLRSSGAMFFAAAQVSKTGNYYELATTQDHHLIDQVGIDMRQQRGRRKIRKRGSDPRNHAGGIEAAIRTFSRRTKTAEFRCSFTSRRCNSTIRTPGAWRSICPSASAVMRASPPARRKTIFPSSARIRC